MGRISIELYFIFEHAIMVGRRRTEEVLKKRLHVSRNGYRSFLRGEK